VHLMTRVFGDAHYLRPASSVDFKGHGMAVFQNLEDLLGSICGGKSKNEITNAVTEAENFFKAQPSLDSANLEFPDRWNSGQHLQLLLYSFIRLNQIETIVETGTANGASALAIAGALEANQRGDLFTFDIETSGAPLVPNHLRHRIEFIKTDGTPAFLFNFLESKVDPSKKSLFLHDADHSYLGQFSDFEVAKKLQFNFIFSDDIDTSLAFCDFAGSNGKVFFDAPKFIGCLTADSK